MEKRKVVFDGVDFVKCPVAASDRFKPKGSIMTVRVVPVSCSRGPKGQRKTSAGHWRPGVRVWHIPMCPEGPPACAWVSAVPSLCRVLFSRWATIGNDFL